MGVITISRQMGSWGRQVARIVAERLSYRMVWRELIDQAAIRAGAPEVALSTIDELGLLGVSPSPKASRAYRQAVEQVLKELAAEGNVVIVGRASQVILRDAPDALHVQVIAPAHLRAERIAQQSNISLKAAQAQVEASDRFRRNYLNRYYHVRWDDLKLYDLVVNTERLNVEAAADLIALALSRRLESTPTSKPQEPMLESV